MVEREKMAGDEKKKRRFKPDEFITRGRENFV